MGPPLPMSLLLDPASDPPAATAPCMLEDVLYVSLSLVTQLPSLWVSSPGASLSPRDPAKGLSLSRSLSLVPPFLFGFLRLILGDLVKGGDRRGLV